VLHSHSLDRICRTGVKFSDSDHCISQGCKLQQLKVYCTDPKKKRKTGEGLGGGQHNGQRDGTFLKVHDSSLGHGKC
jgi:hypothetical protein